MQTIDIVVKDMKSMFDVMHCVVEIPQSEVLVLGTTNQLPSDDSQPTH